MSFKAKLVVDLGNSQTRVLVQYDREDGTLVQKLSTFSNKFAEISANVEIPDFYKEDNTRIFTIETGEIFANGLFAEREYSGSLLRPSAIQPKQDSKVSELSMRCALQEGYNTLSLSLGKPISDLDVVWDIVFLLPPSDLTSGSKKLSEKIRNIKEINFTIPDVHKTITIDKIVAYPEGFAAYLATILRKGRKYNEDFTHLAKATTLLIDIGAGTTDFFVIKDQKIINNTRKTVKIGGINVTSFMRNELINQKGIDLPESVFEKAIETGEISIGASTLKINKPLKRARKLVANTLITEISSFFESTMYSVQSIEYLLVVGGGSIESNLEGVDSLASYLVERMKQLSPNIGLVPAPPKYIGDKKTEHTLNPRLLNVLGGGILAEDL